MSVKYDLFESPTPKGEVEKRALHARIVSGRTIRMDRICTEISAFTSFSSADIKGLLQAFSDQIVSHLKYGDEIELEGLGHFSATLYCPKTTSEAAIQANDIHFKTVKFRCSKKIKKALRPMKFERLPKEDRMLSLPDKQRKENILHFLKTQPVITSSYCMAINQCSRYLALKDIQDLLKEQRLEKLGFGKNIMYRLA
ncbi:HU family DNA-binding protein [Parabacteroides sp. OttesenSCG-928-G07]|nr:HU family DNA-binding protein [Parabacteroides sp. OttesenSCG-928-G21]MDL2277350.1 HU family DNA-binding protein [Parabacteroides sp. OttesenSCG-928-G07]